MVLVAPLLDLESPIFEKKQIILVRKWIGIFVMSYNPITAVTEDSLNFAILVRWPSLTPTVVCDSYHGGRMQHNPVTRSALQG